MLPKVHIDYFLKNFCPYASRGGHALFPRSAENVFGSLPVSYGEPQSRLEILSASLPLYLLGAASFVYSSGDSLGTIQSVPIRISVAHKLVLLPIVFLLALNNFRHSRHPAFQVPLPIWLYSVYVCSGVVSIFVSSYLGYSSYKVFEISTAVLAAIAVAYRAGPKRALQAILAVWSFKLILVWIGIIIAPSLAIISYYEEAPIPYYLNGFLVGWNSNSIGCVGVILFMSYLLVWQHRSRLLRYCWLALLAVTIFIAQSRTSMVALIVAYSLTVIKRRSTITMVIVGIFGLLLYFLLPEGLLVDYLTKGRGIDYPTIWSLSGRTDMWTYALEKMHGKWSTGLGFAFGSRWITESMARETISTLHSDYIDALLSVGFTGPAFLLLAVATALIHGFRKVSDDPYRLCAFAIIIVLAVRSLTGSTLAIGIMYPAAFTSAVLCVAEGK